MNQTEMAHKLDIFHFKGNLLMVGRGVTCTCTAILFWPARHQYQLVFLICRFFKVTVKVLVLSSLMVTEVSS